MSTETHVPQTATAHALVRTSAPADFFSAAEGRIDHWRQLCAVARAWQAAASRGSSEDALFTDAVELFGTVIPLEGFYAYPGPRLLGSIEQALPAYARARARASFAFILIRLRSRLRVAMCATRSKGDTVPHRFPTIRLFAASKPEDWRCA